MKTFKRFELDEATFMTTVATLTQDTQKGNYADPAVRLALNRLVGTVASKTQDGTMIPEQVVAQMRNSLSKLGLTFDEVPMMEGASGSFELPLTSFGGRFGKGVNTPYDEFEVDDGISHQVEGGLSLVLNYAMQEDNSCRLTASIK
jgi:hypothetical protein|tara:strand:- start:322 stop:759 length:438 start_codon:yes stop_codon:yes gene_type:complete